MNCSGNLVWIKLKLKHIDIIRRSKKINMFLVPARIVFWGRLDLFFIFYFHKMRKKMKKKKKKNSQKIRRKSSKEENKLIFSCYELHFIILF